MNEYIVNINGSSRNIKIINGDKILIDNKEYDYELFPITEKTYRFKLKNKFYEISGEKINSELFSVSIGGKYLEVEVRTALQERAKKLLEKKKKLHHKIEVKAPMPGMILKIQKSVGENVEAGDPVIILEAMKMENEVRSPVKGTIKEILVTESAAVEKGTLLFYLE